MKGIRRVIAVFVMMAMVIGVAPFSVLQITLELPLLRATHLLEQVILTLSGLILKQRM